MARESRGSAEYSGQSDAAYMKPRLIPDEDLLPRDDSGGLNFDSYTAEWGDGGRVTGAKAHLSVGSGEGDREPRRSRRDRDDRKGRRED